MEKKVIIAKLLKRLREHNPGRDYKILFSSRLDREETHIKFSYRLYINGEYELFQKLSELELYVNQITNTLTVNQVTNMWKNERKNSDE